MMSVVEIVFTCSLFEVSQTPLYKYTATCKNSNNNCKSSQLFSFFSQDSIALVTSTIT